MELLDIDHYAPVSITAYFSELQRVLSQSSSDTERVHLIGRVERVLHGGGPVSSLLPVTTDQLAEYRLAYKSLLSTLIDCAALPDCEDDCASLPSSAYQHVPSQATAVCSALSAIVGLLRSGSVRTDLLLAVAPDVCVFAVTHFQVSVHRWKPRQSESLQL